ncbi:MAG: methyltransferase domain-containing protein [Phycisphaerales bacterium]|nr:methyltransferase domain-containing protein [Phycisphaerales bacterium]
MRTIYGNWYEYPRYYDIAFGWDPDVEVGFVEDAFHKFGVGPIKRVYEPFCGTGRIAIALAERGYDLIGADIVPAALDFARQRAADHGAAVRWELADASAWSPNEPVDAVVTLIDSFRHLPPEAAKAAVANFAKSLRANGLLIVGVDVGDRPIEVTPEEHWTMERDGVVVQTAVFDLRKPGITPGTTVTRARMAIRERDGSELEIICDDEMARYTLDEFLRLTRGAGFEPLTICDRRYDLRRPIPLSGYAGDIVAVMRLGRAATFVA